MIKDRNIADNANIQPYKIAGGGLGLGVGTGPSGKESKVFYVNAFGGSDNFDGLIPQEPLLTIAEACARVKARHVIALDWSTYYPWTSRWGHNDVISIAPGKYAEALTDIPYGCTFVGGGNAFESQEGYAGKSVVWQPTSTNECIDVARLYGNSFYNIRFRNSGAGKIIDVDEAESLWFENCYFMGYSGTTYALYILDSWMHGGMKNCFIQNVVQGFHLSYNVNKTFHTLHNFYMENVSIMASTTAFYMHANSQATDSLINRCQFGGGGDMTCTNPIDMNCGTGYYPAVHNTHFLGTTIDPEDTVGNVYSNCTHNGVRIT